MRSIVLLSCLLATTSPFAANAACTLTGLGHNEQATAISTTLQFNVGATVPVGDLVVVAAGNSGNNTISSITDNQSNSYTCNSQISVSGSTKGTICYSTLTHSLTITTDWIKVTFSANTGGQFISAVDVPAATANALNNAGTIQTGTTNATNQNIGSCTSCTAPTATGNTSDIAFGILLINNGTSTTVTENGGFVSQYSVAGFGSSASKYDFACLVPISSSPVTFNPQLSASGRPWGANVYTFKAPLLSSNHFLLLLGVGQ